MVRVGVHEAKTHFSRLLRRVAAGEEVLITHRHVPVARLMPVKGTGARQLGTDRDLVIPEDFDAPLPDDILVSFER